MEGGDQVRMSSGSRTCRKRHERTFANQDRQLSPSGMHERDRDANGGAASPRLREFSALLLVGVLRINGPSALRRAGLVISLSRAICPAPV